jgi:hypothetical protein
MSFRRTLVVLTLLMFAAIGLAGCSDRTGPGAGVTAPHSLSADARSKVPPPEFDPTDFVSGVDNPYFPLEPGTTWMYISVLSHTSVETTVVTVTSDPKTVMGVEATVVHEQVIVDGELVEDTFDWFAQDAAGNVWYLGEDTKEYEDGQIVSTGGSWEAGVDGAEPGIIMLATPTTGATYAQEGAPGVAEDQAKVISTGATVTVPYGTFSDAVQIAEWSKLDRGPRQIKTYASGVGLVMEARRSGRDWMVLLSVTNAGSAPAHAALRTGRASPTGVRP